MNARFARVLAPLGLLPLVSGVAFFGATTRAAEIAAVNESPATAASDAAATETEARLSLDVESAPLAQVFSLIEAMTQLRARYAAPPDAILSAHFDEEPLLPALEKMLDGSDWTAELSGDSLFLNAPKNAQWKIWAGKTAPRADWNLAPGTREYSLPAVRLNSSPDAPSQLTATLDAKDAAREMSPQEKAARRVEDALWQAAPLAFEARRVPGIRVATGESANAKEKLEDEKKSGENAASTRMVWLRCDFALRVVPARLYLSIVTPAATTLFINGAPALMQRSGQSRVELSQFVRRGANRVALLWKNAPPFSSSQPLLRYEWQTDLAP